ncbi:hypothetical protein BCR36DRAFT_362920 [Piromyces finnis]|uniref:DUF1279 domain-containing protein n=1 Tax=Piromyces finnis TaxID=1754191 RepID=A0A1Y1UXA7_9FUNG|nr:hypothetical protein BCR36DRAFT_362920 [Piromyces finnis]|eukprot:ORX42142.1 hypothetical protein BCR36DRAFT_362920 [Piromyces finnis]
MICRENIITVIYKHNNINKNIIKNTISKYYKNINLDKPSSININISRNVSSKALNLNTGLNNIRPLPTIQNKCSYSTLNSHITKNGYKESLTFGVIDVPKEKLNNNDIINTMTFSIYNKRFMSSLQKFNKSTIDQKINSTKYIVQNMTYTTEAKPINNNKEKTNTGNSNTTNKEQAYSQNSNNKTKEKQKNLMDVIREYGIIAVIIYLSLTALFYFPTLAVVLYYDLDPDELYKQSKEYISNLGKRVINKIKGKVEYIEETLEEAKQKKLERKNESTEISITKADENDDPTTKRKKLFKKLVVTYAIAQVISPPKSLITIMVTPYIAKILRKRI